MPEFDYQLNPIGDRDLADRQDRCQKARKAVGKALFMRLLVCGLLIFILLRAPMKIWVIGLMVLVLLINGAGALPLMAEWKKRSAEWKQLLEEENKKTP